MNSTLLQCCTVLVKSGCITFNQYPSHIVIIIQFIYHSLSSPTHVYQCRDYGSEITGYTYPKL